jgi:hypothetical protein
MPAARWTARTEGRDAASERLGSGRSFMDLSVSMEGEVARRAARECFDGAEMMLVADLGIGMGQSCLCFWPLWMVIFRVVEECRSAGGLVFFFFNVGPRVKVARCRLETRVTLWGTWCSIFCRQALIAQYVRSTQQCNKVDVQTLYDLVKPLCLITMTAEGAGGLIGDGL